MGIQIKNFPYLYDYKYNPKGKLTDAINIVEKRSILDMNSLTFKFPIKQFDYYGLPVLDGNGVQKSNPKINYIINDNLLKYKNTWYVIKINEDILTSGNETFINVNAHEISYELTEKFVQYLNLSPPIHDAVNVETALKEILESSQQVRDNYVVSATSTTIVLDSDAHPSNDFYNGYKIKIIYGNGLGEEKTITDYVGSTKTITIDSSWTTIPNSDSVYRIYNDIWKIGTIDGVFNADLREHIFDYVTCFEALNSAKNQYIDPLTNISGYFTYDITYNSTENKWSKVINLVRASSYKGIDIRYKKNMQTMNRKIDSEKIYTKMIFEGKDNLTIVSEPTEQRTDNAITYYAHLENHNEIYNFQYFLENYTLKECYDNFIKEYHFSDTRYTDSNNMFEDGKKLLETLSIPKITYTTTALDLSTILGRESESFSEGDTLKIYNEDLGIDIFATISSISIPEDNPQNASLELTNQVERMSDLLERIMNRSDSKLNRDKTTGKSVTVVIADKKTSINWKDADYFVGENETADDLLSKVLDSIPIEGGRIILLAGTYIFKSRIDIRGDNITIEGQGNSTILKMLKGITPSSTLGFIEFENSNFTNLKNFKIDGSVSSGYSRVGIRAIATYDCLIQDITIDNVNGYGIKLDVADRVTIKNVNIDNVSIDSSGDSFGIRLANTSDNIIENMNIKNCKDGIYEDNSSHDNFFKNVNSSLNSNIGFTIDSDNSTYDNCFSHNNTQDGFYLSSNQSNTLLNSCKTYSNAGSGLWANGSSNFKVNNILVDSNGDRGIYLLGTCKNVYIDNSTVINSGDYGISFDVNSSDGWINNTYVYNNTSRNISILGDNTIIRDTKVRDGSTPIASYGLYIAIASNCYVVNNDFRNSGTTPFYDGGTNTHTTSENIVI